jgi:Zn-dependent protease
MFRSWRIGSIAGISVYVHWTFLILLAFISFSGLSAGGTHGMALELLTILMLFGIVVLHEASHALAARHFGIDTRDITLYPIGGVARLERMPSRPVEEIVVAAAGPAMNVALASAAFLIGQLPVAAPAAWLLSRLVIINVALAIFNLLPAFPLDGGRVLRALLALRIDYVRATSIAARIGRGMAVLFGILGLFGNPNLLLIAVFVWMAAGSEERQVQLAHAARRDPLYWFANTPRDQWWGGWRRTPRETWFRVVED